MSGINSIFSIGKRALVANQLGIHITGENISNAENPEYSRQKANLVSDEYVLTGNHYLGSGVKVESVQRMRDKFRDIQIWQGKAQLAEYESGEKYANLIEGIFTDLDEGSLSDQLDQFWNTWMELGNHPEDYGIRNGLKSKAQNLIQSFHNMDWRLNKIKEDAVNELKRKVEDANDIIHKIADMNKKILKNTSANGFNNTMLDKRDALIDELSELVDVRPVFHNNGTVSLSSNSHVLVDGANDYELSLDLETTGKHVDASLILDDNRSIELKSGEIKNLFHTINTRMPTFIKKFDTMVKAFVEKVNEVHEKNYTLNREKDIAFFAISGLSANSIQLSNQIKNDIANIAISKNGQTGDGAGAQDIADIRNLEILSEGKETVNSFYRSLVGQVGDYSKNMQENVASQTDVVNVMENQRQAIKGVSLEEEMVNMIKFQNAFQAASQLITTVDELMQTVIGMVR